MYADFRVDRSNLTLKSRCWGRVRYNFRMGDYGRHHRRHDRRRRAAGAVRDHHRQPVQCRPANFQRHPRPLHVNISFPSLSRYSSRFVRSWFLSVSGRDNDSKYSSFIKAQADKVLEFAVGPAGWYSNLWYGTNGGPDTWTASSQASALGALVAAGQQNC